MAFYYGDSIGDAARAEERALDRALNLALANRQFRAQEYARDQAIDAQNNANALAAQQFGAQMRQRDLANTLAMRLKEREDKENRNRWLEQLAFAREQGEMQRDLSREGFARDLERFKLATDKTNEGQLYTDLEKRIGAGEISDLPMLNAAVGGQLTPEKEEKLARILGLVQRKMSEAEKYGPVQAAEETNAALDSDIAFTGAKKPEEKKAAFKAFYQNTVLRNNKLLGKVAPDFENMKFVARPSPRSNIPLDAYTKYYKPAESESETNPEAAEFAQWVKSAPKEPAFALNPDGSIPMTNLDYGQSESAAQTTAPSIARFNTSAEARAAGFGSGDEVRIYDPMTKGYRRAILK